MLLNSIRWPEEANLVQRSIPMYGMHEELARAHSRERLQQAQQARRGHQLALAQRYGRKAERAALRARLHLARAL